MYWRCMRSMNVMVEDFTLVLKPKLKENNFWMFSNEFGDDSCMFSNMFYNDFEDDSCMFSNMFYNDFEDDSCMFSNEFEDEGWNGDLHRFVNWCFNCEFKHSNFRYCEFT